MKQIDFHNNNNNLVYSFIILLWNQLYPQIRRQNLGWEDKKAQ